MTVGNLSLLQHLKQTKTNFYTFANDITTLGGGKSSLLNAELNFAKSHGCEHSLEMTNDRRKPLKDNYINKQELIHFRRSCHF